MLDLCKSGDMLVGADLGFAAPAYSRFLPFPQFLLQLWSARFPQSPVVFRPTRIALGASG